MHPWKIFSFCLFSLEILLPETIFRPSWIPTTNPHLHLLNARILQCSKEFPSKANETSARNSQTVTFGQFCWSWNRATLKPLWQQVSLTSLNVNWTISDVFLWVNVYEKKVPSKAASAADPSFSRLTDAATPRLLTELQKVFSGSGTSGFEESF